MLFANKNNSLSQLVAMAVKQKNHRRKMFEINQSSDMISYSKLTQPDLIMCPFLTKRVPQEVWKNPEVPCLIVHPGIEGDRGMSFAELFAGR